MSSEGPKVSSGGLAYEVILKPAQTENAPVRSPSPPKEMSQEEVTRKLQEAENRRVSLEMQKMDQIAKGRQKALQAKKKMAEEEQKFVKLTEEKLQQDLQAKEAKRNARLEGLQEKLKDHLGRVEFLAQKAKLHVEQNSALKKKIEEKLTAAEEKRKAELVDYREKLKEHEKTIRENIEEIRQASTNLSKQTEEKAMLKMELAVKNREEQLTNIKERIRDHIRHAEKVREKKQTLPLTEDRCA